MSTRIPRHGYETRSRGRVRPFPCHNPRSCSVLTRRCCRPYQSWKDRWSSSRGRRASSPCQKEPPGTRESMQSCGVALPRRPLHVLSHRLSCAPAPAPRPSAAHGPAQSSLTTLSPHNFACSRLEVRFLALRTALGLVSSLLRTELFWRLTLWNPNNNQCDGKLGQAIDNVLLADNAFICRCGLASQALPLDILDPGRPIARSSPVIEESA